MGVEKALNSNRNVRRCEGLGMDMKVGDMGTQDGLQQSY